MREAPFALAGTCCECKRVCIARVRYLPYDDNFATAQMPVRCPSCDGELRYRSAAWLVGGPLMDAPEPIRKKRWWQTGDSTANVVTHGTIRPNEMVWQ